MAISLNLIPAIFAMFLLIYLIYKTNKNNVTYFSADPPIPVLKKLYHQRLLEIENVDAVLDRPIVQGDHNIENLKLLPEETDYQQPDLQNINQEAIPQNPPNIREMKLIKARMLAGTTLVYINNNIFYWDKQYSTELTPVEFAYNPKKYVTENPTLFPSYEIYKNNHHFMPKEQRIPV